MNLIVRKSGILSTIQDLGRTGARSFGVNPTGVMDRAAARLLNLVLGNDESAPVLEMHFPAPQIEFSGETGFAIGGGDFGSVIDETPIRNWSAARATKGSVLKFTKKLQGSRAYLAVPGGFEAEKFLGSASTNLTAGIGRMLTNGDELKCSDRRWTGEFTIGVSARPRYSRFPTVRIIAGPEFDFMTPASERTFLRQEFALTNDCNRMGFRLKAEPLHLLHSLDMVSAAVTFGTIQLLPDGQLIVLMADHQTSGGYPRIGNVVSVDLPVLAQCGPGDRIRFELVTIAEAETLAMRFERELNYLRVGCRLQGQNANR